MVKVKNTESGFIFSGIAIIAVIILTVVISWLASNAAITSKVASNYAITSQSHWGAVSGLEVGKSNLDAGITSFNGDYEFSGSIVTLGYGTIDRNGNALPASIKRIESSAQTDVALRKMEMLFQSLGTGGGWPDTSIIEEVPLVKYCPRGTDSKVHPCINVSFAPDNLSVTVQTLCKKLDGVVLQYLDCTEDAQSNKSGNVKTFSGRGKNNGKIIVGIWVKSGNNLSGDGPDYGEYFENPAYESYSEFVIKGSTVMNGQIYIAGDVSIQNSATMGNIEQVNILVPAGKTVEDQIGSTTTWQTHSPMYLPDLKEEIYDSLLAIANQIQNTEDNYKMGELILTKTTLDLTQFPTKTYFIYGDFSLRGSTVITDATAESPAMITATGNVFIERAGRDQSFVPDNVIIVSAGTVTVKDNSVFGTGVESSEGVPFKNQLFGKQGVVITGNPTVYSQVLSPEIVQLEGTSKTYGRIYAGNSFQIYGDAYFEGILMARIANSPYNSFTSGSLNFKPYFPINYVTAKEGYKVVMNSLREF